jgi:hypothetical protein
MEGHGEVQVQQFLMTYFTPLSTKVGSKFHQQVAVVQSV